MLRSEGERLFFRIIGVHRVEKSPNLHLLNESRSCLFEKKNILINEK